METRSARSMKEAVGTEARPARRVKKEAVAMGSTRAGIRGKKEARRVEPRATRRRNKSAAAAKKGGSTQPPSPEMDLDAELVGPEEVQKAAESNKGVSALAKRVRDEADGDEEEDDDDEEEEDREAANAINFREFWMYLWSDSANFEDITDIPSMRFTDELEEGYVHRLPSLQVFAIEVKQIKRGLRWPIEVFGHVALRDAVDFKRNLLFSRGRDDCQTLTAEDSFLVLTGPSRYALAVERVYFELELKVKGITVHQDKVLNSLAFAYNCFNPDRRLVREVRSNKRSTVEITFARFPRTVEATLEVKLFEGSWASTLLPHLFASTHSLPDVEFVLIDPREGTMVVSEDGIVKLTRSVVSVEVDGELRLTAEAWEGDNGEDIVATDTTTFKPLIAGRTTGMLDLGFCKISVTIAWSKVHPA